MFHRNSVRNIFLRIYSIAIILFLMGSAIFPTQPAIVAAATPPPQPTPTPVLKDPANNIITEVSDASPLGIPEVSWYPVTDAIKYELQFSSSYDSSSPEMTITTINTRYTPANTNSTLLNNRDWYWKVRAYSTAGGWSSFSEIRKFTRAWSNEELPILLAPEDAANLDFFNESTFSWTPVTGAAYYRFQVSKDDTFSTLVDGGNVKTLSTTYQPLLKWDNGLYYWRVVPFDAGGQQGTSSAFRTFYMAYGIASKGFGNEIPTLLEPADDSSPIFTPTFRWKAVRGATFYRLEYSSDINCQSGVGFNLLAETPSNTFTPNISFPNDIYCWRVRAQSGNMLGHKSISEWSPIWNFTKNWNIKPVLLTPTNFAQAVHDPYFSWTPVPGAAHYRIEVNYAPSLPPVGSGNCQFIKFTTNTNYFQLDSQPVCGPLPGVTYWWRVIPLDKFDKEGVPSDTGQFRGGALETIYDFVPQLAYPLYYYRPNNYPVIAQLNPYEDRSVAYPIFKWHRLVDVPDNFNVTEQAAAYRVQVVPGDSRDFSACDPLDPAKCWTYDTENMNASPAEDNPIKPFTPTYGIDYSWRVCPINALGDPIVEDLCSDVWKTRFDATKALAPTSGSAPVLLRPFYGEEFVETTPLLEWWPYQNADSYEIEISTDPGFAQGFTVVKASTRYPAYSPVDRLDYAAGDPNYEYGPYYWRVRPVISKVAGSWSPTWRFQTAAQSAWRELHAPGSLYQEDRVIGYDPANDMPENLNVNKLYAAESGVDGMWYFGFNSASPDAETAHVIYIDEDMQAGSGATTDPNGYHVSTIAAHRPEYAIYIIPDGITYTNTNSQVYFYQWEDSAWSLKKFNIGGSLYYSPTIDYVELKINGTYINMGQETGSMMVSMFTVEKATGDVKDTVPSLSAPPVAGVTTVLDRFAGVSGHLTVIEPATNQTGDPITYPTILPMTWHKPVDVPWYGYNVQVSVYMSMSNPIDQVIYGSSIAFGDYIPLSDFNGDNTYFWRVRPLYYYPHITRQYISGAWSQVHRLERTGFVPKNLTPPNLDNTNTYGTPTFKWDRVEGAQNYTVQVDSDPSFGSLDLNINTPEISYTPINNMGTGKYYWRVQANRYQNITNDWSETKAFTLTLPVPQNPIPNDPVSASVFNTMPTLCWDSVLRFENGIPMLAAWKYRVEISKDNNFSGSNVSRIETEQNCYTPTTGFADGKYYWHVAVLQNNIMGTISGGFSETASFTKRYGKPTLLSPLGGSVSTSAPTFSWTPVDGAAKYLLQVSQNPTFSTIFEEVRYTVNNSYTPIQKIYIPGGFYFWRVAMVDADGNVGPFTSIGVQVFLPAITKP